MRRRTADIGHQQQARARGDRSPRWQRRPARALARTVIPPAVLAALLVPGAHVAGAAVPQGPELATTVLARIKVESEHRGGYERALFEHWSDIDGDGCSGREQVLRDESLDPPQVDPFGCKVLAGRWRSAYDGMVTEDPTDFDVDHVVALKEAWDSGAWSWSAERRKAFANDTTDPRTLRAVSATSNRVKSDKDPSNWIPPERSLLCTYLSDWISIKARWGLSMDQSEVGYIRKQLRSRCATTTVAPWPPINLPISSATNGSATGTVSASSSTATAAGATASTGATAAAGTAGSTGASGSGSAVVYPNCASARAAGAAPLRRGAPGYSPKLDRDGDGVACE